MNQSRRLFLQLTGIAATLPFVCKLAHAQTYPAKLVRLVSPFPAGGPSDLVARALGQYLSDHLGQQFIVENRPGGGGMIAVEAVARSQADGYTIVLLSGAHAVNTTLTSRFNLARDIMPIAGIIRLPNVVVVHPSVPAKTLPELIAYAKANPGKINFASGGTGTTSHVMGELFKMMAGLDMTHIPYRGTAPALNDLLGGQVQLYFSPTATAIGLIKTDRLRALAVTGAARSETLPQVPTIGEFVPGYEATNWFGLGAPSSTPTDIVAKLNSKVNAALAEPAIRARFAKLDCTIIPGSPADFEKLVAVEIEKWAKVVKFAGLKAS